MDLFVMFLAARWQASSLSDSKQPAVIGELLVPLFFVITAIMSIGVSSWTVP